MPSLNAQNMKTEDNEYQLSEIDFHTLSLHANQILFSFILLGKFDFFARDEGYKFREAQGSSDRLWIPTKGAPGLNFRFYQMAKRCIWPGSDFAQVTHLSKWRIWASGAFGQAMNLAKCRIPNNNYFGQVTDLSNWYFWPTDEIGEVKHFAK